MDPDLTTDDIKKQGILSYHFYGFMDGGGAVFICPHGRVERGGAVSIRPRGRVWMGELSLFVPMEGWDLSMFVPM